MEDSKSYSIEVSSHRVIKDSLINYALYTIVGEDDDGIFEVERRYSDFI